MKIGRITKDFRKSGVKTTTVSPMPEMHVEQPKSDKPCQCLCHNKKPLLQRFMATVRKMYFSSENDTEQSTTAKAASVIGQNNTDSFTIVHEILDRADATMRRIEMQRANVQI